MPTCKGVCDKKIVVLADPTTFYVTLPLHRHASHPNKIQSSSVRGRM